MLITVASRATINWVMLSTASVHHRRPCANARGLLVMVSTA